MNSASVGAEEGTVMVPVSGNDDSYQTEPQRIPARARLFPSGAFYRRLITIVCKSALDAKRGRYGDFEWYRSSLDVMEALEEVGVQVEITGLEHLRGVDSSCVIVGNHMSMLESFVLPGVVRPFLPVTFVVKSGLLTYPVFGHVMRSRNPVAVSRTQPREDFATVMKEGQERLAKGISVIVFPQTTRTNSFDPKEFNSLGVKLARRAAVPVVPVAVSTDAWCNGRILKDFGKIDVSRKVQFAFGEPMNVQDLGNQANPAVIEFIQDHLATWQT